MATRETRLQRGRRLGTQTLRRLINELRDERQLAGLSQRALANQLGISQAELSRLEQFGFSAVPLIRLSEMASILGLELSASLHRKGDAVRDSGQQAAVKRILECVSPAYIISREALLPNVGDQRSWDILLRLESLLVGLEVETRIRDVQALVRRIRERERDGGVDDVLLVLSDTSHNRELVGQLRDALGPRFATPPKLILAALRAGEPVPGSGVILI